MSMGAFSAVVKSSTMIISSKTFGTILGGIQEMLNKSRLMKFETFTCLNNYEIFKGEKENQFKQYENYSKIEKKYSRLYGIFMLMSAQTICIGPLISVLYGVYKGDYHFRYPCEVV